MKIIKIVLLAAVAVMAVSCCSCRKNNSTTGGTRHSASLTGTTWQLVEIDGTKFKASGDSFTLILADDGKVSGKGDCNRMMGSYTKNDAGMLTFGRLAGTMIYCPNQADEDKFLVTIETIDSYAIDGDMLALSSGGSTRMVFRKVVQ